MAGVIEEIWAQRGLYGECHVKMKTDQGDACMSQGAPKTASEPAEARRNT